MAKAYGLFQGVQDLHISYVRVLYYTLFPVKRMCGCYGVILPAGYWFDRHDWSDLLKGCGLFSLFFFEREQIFFVAKKSFFLALDEK
jgi:hypothetical protein